MIADNLYVIKRFVLKTLLLGSFSLLHGRGETLRTAGIFFLMAAILDAGLASMRHERLSLRRLSHWDESVGFLALCATTIVLSSTLA